MNDPILLIFNPASSTIKLGLFAVEAKAPQRFGQGVIELRHQPLALQITEGPATATIPLKAVVADDLHEVTEESLLWLVRHWLLWLRKQDAILVIATDEEQVIAEKDCSILFLGRSLR